MHPGLEEGDNVAGVKAYDRATYLADVKALKQRGWTVARIARELGISERTVYRMVSGR
jgi:predicted transcriptional regulator